MNVPRTYTPPPLMKNGHIQTVFPSLFRKIKGVTYARERIETPDDDFLDLDWSRQGHRRLAVISHGLEGDSDRAYVKGMVRALNLFGWDCLAWNFRGCGGQINRRLKFYHSGSCDDLDTVVRHAAAGGIEPFADRRVLHDDVGRPRLSEHDRSLALGALPGTYRRAVLRSAGVPACRRDLRPRPVFRGEVR